MNLLFLDSIEADVYGGMEEWIRLVASGLVARGHRVRVVGRPDSRFLERLERETENVQLTPLEISGDFNPSTISALKRLMKEDGTDIVVTNFNKDLRLGGLAAKLDGEVRVVWSIGLDITKDSLVHRLLTPRLFDGIIVPSHALRAQITRHGYIDSEVVEVVPIGIPDQVPGLHRADRFALRKEYGIAEGALVAVTLGRFVDQKGHRYLIEALSLMREKGLDITLLWCGDGPLRAELQQLAEASGVADRIIFAGMLNDITPALAAADMMVHPSVEEPFGIAVLEGMRAGLPIVASRVGGIPEVVGETAVLVEARNGQELARGIASLANNKAEAQRLGAAARLRFVEHFTHTVMVNRLEGYFASLVQTEKRRG